MSGIEDPPEGRKRRDSGRLAWRMPAAAMVILSLTIWPATTIGEEGSPPSVKTGRGHIDASDGSEDLVMRGSLNPNGSETICRFEFGPDDRENPPGPYVHSVPCAEDPGAGTSEVTVSARIAGVEVPDGEADHFRLVAANAFGRAEGEDESVLTLVCSCGLPELRPGVPRVDWRAHLRSGQALLRVSCHGGNQGCEGSIRLVARIRRKADGPVRERRVGESSYEVATRQQRVVPISLPMWAKRLLGATPNLAVRFLVDGPELNRSRVRFPIPGSWR